jgi:hypothetical protein
MIWIGIGVTVVAGILMTILVVVKRPADPGSVSGHWIAEHWIDPPDS